MARRQDTVLSETIHHHSLAHTALGGMVWEELQPPLLQFQQSPTPRDPGRLT